MEELKIEAPLPAHDAFNDAIYTARVAKALNLRRGVRNYQELNGVLWHSMHSEKELFHPFKTRERALADPALMQVICPVCGKTLKVKGYTELDEKNLEAQVKTKHGTLLLRLKVMRNRRRNFYIKRTVRFL